MATHKIGIEEFLQLSKDHLVIDVRSEGEYNLAHIPDAHNLPLFNNEERKVVGILYKQVSREDAIKKGLDFYGVKMRSMVESVEKLINNNTPTNKTVLVHCWRGGMRSAGVGWLLDLYGFKVYTLSGGYKGFRQWAIRQFNEVWPAQRRIQLAPAPLPMRCLTHSHHTQLVFRLPPHQHHRPTILQKTHRRLVRLSRHI